MNNLTLSPHRRSLSGNRIARCLQWRLHLDGTFPVLAAFYIFIQQIYVLNILNMLHNLSFFSLQNVIYFIMLPILVPVLFTF